MLLVSILMGVWMGDARGAINFDPAVPYETGHHPEGGVLFDFTNDGFLDLAVTSDDPNQIQFFVNQGDGTFDAPFSLETGNATGPEGLAAGDRVASGTYWIELAAGGAQQSQRLVYLR